MGSAQYEVEERIVNAATATIYGLDFDGSLRVTRDFQFRLPASYLPTSKYDRFDDATWYALLPGQSVGPVGSSTVTGYASGRRILKTPKVRATLSGDYTDDTPWGALDASASLYYPGSYSWESDYRVRTQSHENVNAQVSLTPTNSHVKYTLWGKNRTNKAYVQGFVEAASADMAIYGPPREIGVSTNYQF